MSMHMTQIVTAFVVYSVDNMAAPSPLPHQPVRLVEQITSGVSHQIFVLDCVNNVLSNKFTFITYCVIVNFFMYFYSFSKADGGRTSLLFLVIFSLQHLFSISGQNYID